MKRLSDIPLEIAERLVSVGLTVILLYLWAGDDLARACCAITFGSSEYSHECIVVDGGRVRVCIRGTNLQLVAMDSTALLISGTIACAEFA